MKLTSIQKKALLIWFFGSPIVSFSRFYFSKPEFLEFKMYWQMYKNVFFKHLVIIYVVIGLICFLLFFLLKDKPKAVKVDDSEELKEKIAEEKLVTNNQSYDLKINKDNL